MFLFVHKEHLKSEQFILFMLRGYLQAPAKKLADSTNSR